MKFHHWQKFMLSFLFLPLLVSAQNQIILKGKVIDSTNNQPLAYTNIGVLGTSIGTISSPDGNFELYLSEEINPKTSIRFSYLGYTSQDFSIEKLTEIDNLIIHLQKENLTLSTIEVRPKFLNTKTIGHKKTTPMRVTNFAISKQPSQNLGASIGRKFNIKADTAFLQSFQFFIAFNNFEEVRFRINIYNLKNGKPYQNIHSNNIIATLKNKKRGWIEIDLSDYNLQAKEDIAISLEWIYHSEKGSHLSLPLTFPTIGTHFYKFGSQDSWKRFRGMSTAMKLTYEY